jgi:hypothetical protein
MKPNFKINIQPIGGIERMSKRSGLSAALAVACLGLACLASTIGVTARSPASALERKYHYECWSNNEPNKPREGTCYSDKNTAVAEAEAHKRAYPAHASDVMVTECR